MFVLLLFYLVVAIAVAVAVGLFAVVVIVEVLVVRVVLNQLLKVCTDSWYVNNQIVPTKTVQVYLTVQEYCTS